MDADRHVSGEMSLSHRMRRSARVGPRPLTRRQYQFPYLLINPPKIGKCKHIYSREMCKCARQATLSSDLLRQQERKARCAASSVPACVAFDRIGQGQAQARPLLLRRGAVPQRTLRGIPRRAPSTRAVRRSPAQRLSPRSRPRTRHQTSQAAWSLPPVRQAGRRGWCFRCIQPGCQQAAQLGVAGPDHAGHDGSLTGATYPRSGLFGGPSTGPVRPGSARSWCAGQALRQRR